MVINPMVICKKTPTKQIQEYHVLLLMAEIEIQLTSWGW